MSSSPRSTATISTMAARSISPRSSTPSARVTPATTIEILTPDFLRKDGALEIVVAAKPDVFNHNLETVPSNYLTVRPGARYFHSIRLLQRVKELDPSIFTKSGIMVGLGEERNEVLQLMDDLRIGQCRLHDHRPVSAAVEEAPSGEEIRHAGRVQVLRDDRLDQGLPDGGVEPADALVASRRRRFRQAARRARGAAEQTPVSRLFSCRNSKQRARPPHAGQDVCAGRRRREISAVPAALQALTVRSRKERDGRTLLVADMTRRLQGDPRDVHHAGLPEAGRAHHRRQIHRRPVPISRATTGASTRPPTAARDVHFFIDYEFKSRILGALMGSMFDRAFRMFSDAFEKRADEIYGVPSAA